MFNDFSVATFILGSFPIRGSCPLGKLPTFHSCGPLGVGVGESLSGRPKGGRGRLIELQFYTENNFGTLTTGRLIGGGRLVRGRLIGA